MNALTLGLIAAFCWGAHDIAIRYLSRTVPLLGALFVVLVVGLVFQLSALLAFGTLAPVQPQVIWLSAGAGLSFLFASLGLYYAFERGPVRVVAPIIGAYPILSLAYAALLGAEIPIPQIVAVLVVIIGVALVAVLSDTAKDKAPPIGPTILLSLVSAVCFATTFKLSQMAALLSGELQAALMARLVATALLCIILIRKTEHLRIARKALFPLGIMGILDGVALLAVISAADKDQPQLAAVAASLFGMITIVLAWLLLKERMSPLQWFGCLLTFLAIGYLSI